MEGTLTMLFTPTLQSDLLAGRVAVVTGGAQGIGRATAETLAANGAKVCIADLGSLLGVEVAAGIGESAVSFSADLVQPGAADDLVEFAVRTFGQLDILVNNAGYAWDAPLHRMTDEQFQAMLDVHLTLPFRLCRAAAPYMREPGKAEQERGEERFRKVVMVSSLAASFGNIGAGNYAAAKAGLLGLMRSLANEWGPYKVNVNAVAFGAIQTRFAQPQTERSVLRTGGQEIHIGLSAKALAQRGVIVDPDHQPTTEEIYTPTSRNGIALGRTGTVQEAADAIFWLTSPLSNYVTGQVVVVSGGARGGLS
jgi:3-oxoacyl-[acyl-carrier protein] reductase